MITDWKILITTGPLDEDYLIAEIYYKGEEWAELSDFGTILKIHPKAINQPWILNVEEVVDVIKLAQDKLRGEQDN